MARSAWIDHKCHRKTTYHLGTVQVLLGLGKMAEHQGEQVNFIYLYTEAAGTVTSPPCLSTLECYASKELSEVTPFFDHAIDIIARAWVWSE